MFAMGLNMYGGPDVLQPVQFPTPHPLPGQVRVKVRAAGINPIDIMVRDGSLTDGLEREIRAIFVNVRERIMEHAALSQLGKLTEEGVLSLRVAAVYPAAEAAAAHRRVEEGILRGRVILDFTAEGIPV